MICGTIGNRCLCVQLFRCCLFPRSSSILSPLYYRLNLKLSILFLRYSFFTVSVVRSLSFTMHTILYPQFVVTTVPWYSSNVTTSFFISYSFIFPIFPSSPSYSSRDGRRVSSNLGNLYILVTFQGIWSHRFSPFNILSHKPTFLWLILQCL